MTAYYCEAVFGAARRAPHACCPRSPSRAGPGLPRDAWSHCTTRTCMAVPYSCACCKLVCSWLPRADHATRTKA
jgi:hypothetical protein